MWVFSVILKIKKGGKHRMESIPKLKELEYFFEKETANEKNAIVPRSKRTRMYYFLKENNMQELTRFKTLIKPYLSYLNEKEFTYISLKYGFIANKLHSNQEIARVLEYPHRQLSTLHSYAIRKIKQVMIKENRSMIKKLG